MFNCWVFGSANSVTRPDRDNQYNMRIVYNPSQKEIIVSRGALQNFFLRLKFFKPKISSFYIEIDHMEYKKKRPPKKNSY